MRLVLGRLVQAVLTFLGATLVLFAMVTLLPGDEIRALFGLIRPDPQDLRLLQDVYHLNEPFHVRYGLYMADLLRGDLGPLYTRGGLGAGIVDRGTVNTIVGAALPTTLRVLSIALLTQLAVGLPVGIALARTRKRSVDASVLAASVVVVGIPVVVTASLARTGAIVTLGTAYTSSTGWVEALLPGIIAGLVPTALLIRVIRQRTAEVLRQPWAHVDRANGMPPRRILIPHAARQAMVTGISLIAVEIGPTLASLLIVEEAMGLGGLGRTLLAAVRDQQGPLVIGGVITFIGLGIIATLLADILVLALEPRTRPAA